MNLSIVGAGLQVYREVFDKEDSEGACVIETGELRTAGLNGWNYGRRVNVLGEFFEDVDVTLEFAFNGKLFNVKDRYTWQLRNSDFTAGEAVELEVTLPVQLYSTIRFRLSWTPISASPFKYSFHANGLTVYFDAAQEGPRLPARVKG
jgi:hypothetical protein